MYTNSYYNNNNNNGSSNKATTTNNNSAGGSRPRRQKTRNGLVALALSVLLVSFIISVVLVLLGA